MSDINWDRANRVLKAFDHFPHFYLDYLGDAMTEVEANGYTPDSLGQIRSIRILYNNTYGASTFDVFLKGEEARHVVENLKIKAIDDNLITRVISGLAGSFGFDVSDSLGSSIVVNTELYSYGCERRENGKIKFDVSAL